MKRGALSPFLALTCTLLSLLFSIVCTVLRWTQPNPVFRLSTYCACVTGNFSPIFIPLLPDLSPPPSLPPPPPPYLDTHSLTHTHFLTVYKYCTQTHTSSHSHSSPLI
ncbi:hypothetical protein B9Z19DRAFT_1075188, partial [Tuber borchii]